MVFTARKQSLGQANIFAPVCHSVHRGEYLGRYPRAGTPLWQVHPHLGRYTSLGRYPQQVNPLGRYYPSRQVTPPPPAVHAGIRSTSGRYAS